MKELEDFTWFPAILRNFQTQFIGLVVTQFSFYTPFILYLKELVPVQKPLTDLCSGSGEPAISIFTQSECFSSLLLTDKFPIGLSSNDNRIRYDQQTIDVLQLEFTPDRYYTMFNAFHHFNDKEKQQLVKKMQSAHTDVFCVEVLEPTVLCFIKVFLMTTVGCVLLTPFIRPFSAKRLFFTYLLPVTIFTITYDGLLSVFKSRSVKQYKKLFAHTNRNIRIQRLTNGLSSIILIHIQP